MPSKDRAEGDELQKLINLYENYPNDLACQLTVKYLKKVKPAEVKTQLADAYLTLPYLVYLNDYLSPERFAQGMGVSKQQALTIVSLGRVFHEERALDFKQEK